MVLRLAGLERFALLRNAPGKPRSLVPALFSPALLGYAAFRQSRARTWLDPARHENRDGQP